MKRESWFFESPLPNTKPETKIGFKVKRKILSLKTSQKIEVFDTFPLGRILVLDGILQLSEKYEFIYHEMITHLPIFSHPSAQRVLIIGGGDGGVLREALKHPIKEVYLVEIDRKILEVSEKFLPFLKLKNSLRDKRTKVIFQDGRKFVKRFKNFFDVIVVDSTDPLNLSLPLFQKRFYQNCYLALKKKGIFITQSGNFFDQVFEIKGTVRKLKEIFDEVRISHFFTPDYQGSDFSLTLGARKINPDIKLEKLKERAKDIKGLKYYSPYLHLASFVLPIFYQKKIYGKSPFGL